jgi:hypothetical protein
LTNPGRKPRPPHPRRVEAARRRQKPLARANEVIDRGQQKDVKTAGSDFIEINTWESVFFDRHSNWVRQDDGGYGLQGDHHYIIRGNKGSLEFHYTPELPDRCPE